MHNIPPPPVWQMLKWWREHADHLISLGESMPVTSLQDASALMRYCIDRLQMDEKRLRGGFDLTELPPEVISFESAKRQRAQPVPDDGGGAA